VGIFLAIFVFFMLMNRILLSDKETVLLVAIGGFLVPEIVRSVFMASSSIPLGLVIPLCLVQTLVVF